MKNTIIVNLFGGPCVGKSTVMAALFYQLKVRGIDVEMAPEYAKDLVWEERHSYFDEQIYIFAKQLHRLNRVYGKVDVIITDSPLYCSSVYLREENEIFNKLVDQEFKKFNNLNFYIVRNTEYVENGRNQTKEQAIEKDSQFEEILDNNKVPYIKLGNGTNSIEFMVEMIIEKLKRDEKH